MAGQEQQQSPRSGSIFGAEKPHCESSSLDNAPVMDSNAPDSTATPSEEPSFGLFKLLPAELRLQIWDLNEPGPRTVKVHYDVSIGKFYTTTPSPAILLVCKESRYELLRKWKLHFGTLGHPATVRANLDIDTVQLDSNPLRMGAISRSDRLGIRHLEVGGNELQNIHPDVFLAAIVHVPNLQDLTIVSPPPHRSSLDVGPLPPQGDCMYLESKFRFR